MIVFPLVATGVSAVFAFFLFRQYLGRGRRLPQLAWAVALAQFAIASLAVAVGVTDAWGPFTYKTFWLFGAMLNVPWLALGSVALLAKRWVGIGALVVTVVSSVWAAALTVRGPVDIAVLANEEQIPRGREVWLEAGMVNTARAYSIASWIVVVLIALLSSRPRKGLAPPRERVRGNWLIAAGTTIVAIGGFALSRVGRGSAFSVTLAAGVVVMFAGFLLASRAPRYRVEEPGDSPT